MNNTSQKYACIRGSLTIEAALALPVFLAGYIVILSLVSVVRIECAVSYGVNQTAAELSRYSYMTQCISDSQGGQLLNETLDDMIVNITKLSSLISDNKNENESYDTGNLIKTLTMLSSNRAANDVIGNKVTDMLCRSLIVKYIGEDRQAADRFLMKNGSVTLDDIDFRCSGILKNSRMINVVAVYKVHIRGFSLLDNDKFAFTMENSACTAAWGVRDTGQTVQAYSSKWRLANFERGRAWVNEVKSENPQFAAAPGAGVDLYDCESGVYTQIYSVNVFAQSYTKYESSSECSGAACYTLRKDYYRKVLSSYAKKALKDAQQVKNSVAMEAGNALPCAGNIKRSARLMIIMPEETQENEQLITDINKISENIYTETGVKCEYVFREKALLSDNSNTSVRNEE